MNLFLTSGQSIADVFYTIEESLKIHGKITIYYQGREIGVITKKGEKTSINNDWLRENSLHKG